MENNVIAPVPVVIVGAGPTGITAATVLAQYGVECLLLERWPTVYPQPRAVHIDDESFRILSRLGIADEFASISRPLRGLRLVDRSNDVLAEFRRDTVCGAHGFPQANMFDQPELESLLRANLKRYPRAQLRSNVEVTNIIDAADGRTRISFTDRINGRQHAVEAQYVLGCDGANSLVRKHIGASMRDLKFEQRWLVIDIATDADLHQWDGAHQICDPHRAGTYMRVGNHRHRWEFRLLPGETAADYSDLAALKPLIGAWVSGVPNDALHLVRSAEYTFRAQIADTWRRGNVFLLGDAAHLTPPFIGQGLCSGLRDAMNLAWKLAGVLDGGLAKPVLSTYEQERKPHARHVIVFALGIGWAMTAGGEVGNLVRRIVVPRLHVIPGLRRKISDSKTAALRGSALITKSRMPGRLAGTLCPNPLLSNGQRLDAELGTGFALITKSALSPAQRVLLEQRWASIHVVADRGELADWLGRGHARAAVIRPDRTVMCAGRHVGALCEAIPHFRATTWNAREPRPQHDSDG